MSSPDYKYRVNKPRQVLKLIQKPLRGKPGKKKLKVCKRLKGDHIYEHSNRTSFGQWIDFRCIGCGKRTYIIKPWLEDDLHLWRKKEYTAKDLEFINAYQGDKQIFYA